MTQNSHIAEYYQRLSENTAYSSFKIMYVADHGGSPSFG
jgi:hypothetical protein